MKDHKIRASFRARRSSRAGAVLVAAFGLTIVLLGTPPVGAASADGTGLLPLPVSVPVLSASQLVAAGDAQRAANEIDSYASNSLASLYAGVELTNESTHVVVYLTQPDAVAEAALSHLIPASTIEFRIRGITQAAQQAAHSAVLAALPALTASGLDIASFGPDPQTGAENVSVRNATDQQLSQIEKTFGPAVSATSVSDSYRAAPDASRIADSAPWNAGDFISDRSGDCTSGIPTTNSGGLQYLVTAAHCFPLNASVYNYASSIPIGTLNPMGYVAAIDQRDGYYDAELIRASASAYTFTGPTSTATKATFAGSGNPVVGGLVCTSGAFEGENCLHVISVNACLTSSTTGAGRTLCGENYYYSSNTQSIGQGDSGAPVYSYVTGGVQAVGLHNLHDPNYTTTCTNWYPQTHRLCSGHGWFESIAPVLGTWSLTVN